MTYLETGIKVPTKVRIVGVVSLLLAIGSLMVYLKVDQYMNIWQQLLCAAVTAFLLLIFFLTIIGFFNGEEAPLRTPADYETVARNVQRGWYGNGKSRSEKLKEEHYDPIAVQNIVNRLEREKQEKEEERDETRDELLRLLDAQRPPVRKQPAKKATGVDRWLNEYERKGVDKWQELG